MTPRSAGDGTNAGGGGRAGLTALLLVAVAMGMMLLARATPSAEPFDPRSGGPSGTRGLALLLGYAGGEVSIVDDAPAEADGRRVLVLRADLSDRQAEDLRAFVADGGVVVWADPAADLFTEPDAVAGLPTVDWSPSWGDSNVPLGECSIGALTHLRALLAPSGELLGAESGSLTCFGDSTGGSFAVAAPHSDGWVIRLGDNEGFTNRYLPYADNGPLATALLVPERGAQVEILLGEGRAPVRERAEVTEETTLVDLVRPGVWMALAQLALAFVVLAVAVGIRPGRPVREPRPVPLAGSELVVANGRLMQRAGHSSRAGLWLRSETHRRLCDEFHLPPTTDLARLDAMVVAHTAVPAGTATELLTREVHSPGELLRLSRELRALRRDATAQPTTLDPHPPQGEQP